MVAVKGLDPGQLQPDILSAAADLWPSHLHGGPLW